MPIPLFVHEEHHEAFLLWQLMRRDGILADRGHTLLHIDEHTDLGVPRLRTSIADAVVDLRRLYAFTYDELSSFNFIVPAFHLGLFDRVIWVHRASLPAARSAPRRPVTDEVLTVYSPNGLGRSFDMSRRPPDADRQADVPAGGHDVWFRDQSARDPLPPLANVVLDIDLSYFSSADGANLSPRFEISRAEYERFQCNRFHPLRLKLCCVEEDGGRCYVRLKEGLEQQEMPGRCDEALILERIDVLMEMLERHQVSPVLIHIARSRVSGYTPADQCAWIEESVLARLGRLYAFERRSLDDRCAAEGLSWPLLVAAAVPAV